MFFLCILHWFYINQIIIPKISNNYQYNTDSSIPYFSLICILILLKFGLIIHISLILIITLLIIIPFIFIILTPSFSPISSTVDILIYTICTDATVVDISFLWIFQCLVCLFKYFKLLLCCWIRVMIRMELSSLVIIFIPFFKNYVRICLAVAVFDTPTIS